MKSMKPNKRLSANKAYSDIQLWKTRYETEGVARAEEIERDKSKIVGRLAEAEDTVQSLQEKLSTLEKSKARNKAEIDDLTSECERLETNANITNITNSQTECRYFSSEYFRVKSSNEKYRNAE